MRTHRLPTKTATPPTPPPSPLLLAIETLEDTNYGDHGDRVRRSHVMVPGEAVEDLVRRVFPKLGQNYRWGTAHNPTDEVVIRVMVGADGQPTGAAPPAVDPWSATPGVPF